MACKDSGNVALTEGDEEGRPELEAEVWRVKVAEEALRSESDDGTRTKTRV
jgi:hypothetical protein